MRVELQKDWRTLEYRYVRKWLQTDRSNRKAKTFYESAIEPAQLQGEDDHMSEEASVSASCSEDEEPSHAGFGRRPRPDDPSFHSLIVDL